MRIAIDGNEANVLHRVGSNVYAFELLKHLEEISRGLSDEFTILLASKPIEDLPVERKGWKYAVITPKLFWTQWALPLYLYQQYANYDILLSPGHYAPRLCPIPYVSSVMDLAFLQFPEQFKRKDFLQLKQWTEYSVKRATHVIAISQATKADIVKQYKLKPEKVTVVYPAVTAPKLLPASTLRTHLKKLRVTDPYILYVGTLQPRKNLVRLIEAYEIFRRQLASAQMSKSLKRRIQAEKIQLVIAGKIGWLADEIVHRAQNSSFSKDIILTGYVTEEQKQALIQSSLGTVLVGLYEGFGIPALEALHLGSIPVVSNTSSLPEVTGNAGLTTDPYDTQAIAHSLMQLTLLTQRQRGILFREARIQKERFSWYTSAELVLNILHSNAQKS